MDFTHLAPLPAGKEYTLDEVGVLAPHKTPVDALYCGEVGYLAAQIKSVQVTGYWPRPAFLGNPLALLV